MKIKASQLIAMAVMAATVTARAQAKGAAQPPPPAPPPPPPVFVGNPTPPAALPAEGSYQQQVYGGKPPLVTAEQAQTVIKNFRENLGRLGNPRFVIFINRDLVDEESGLKLSSRKEETESVRNASDKEVKAGGTNGTTETLRGPGQIDRVKADNTYRVRDRKELALADRQTMRDVETLFGRPLRMAGAGLADQRIATQLMEGKPIDSFNLHAASEQARRERATLAKIADVALEVLISSRTETLPGISGDRTYTVPDIQATAVRLSDGKIMGQATSADLTGGAARAGAVYDVRHISEATALALMEDMLR